MTIVSVTLPPEVEPAGIANPKLIGSVISKFNAGDGLLLRAPRFLFLAIGINPAEKAPAMPWPLILVVVDSAVGRNDPRIPIQESG
jgi:hypothetical protein